MATFEPKQGSKMTPIHFEPPTIHEYADMAAAKWMLETILKVAQLRGLLAIAYLWDMLDWGDDE